MNESTVMRNFTNNNTIATATVKNRSNAKNRGLAIIAILLIVLSAMSVAANSNLVVLQRAIAAKYGPMSIFVVPYTTNQNQWNTIIQSQLGNTLKYVIINPNSGPYITDWSFWDTNVNALKAKNIEPVGYIYYTDSNIPDEISTYLKHGIKSIMFDGEGQKDNLSQFEAYACTVHNNGGITYINPGYAYAPVSSYLSATDNNPNCPGGSSTRYAVDVANVYEGGFARIKQIVIPTLTDGSKPDPSRLSSIVNDIAKSTKTMAQSMDQIQLKGIGITYINGAIYTRNLPPYFSQEVSYAQCDQTTDPSCTKYY